MQAVVFDLETTGLSAQRDAILEIGAMVVNDGVVSTEIFHAMVNPGRPIPFFITKINGIDDRMVRDARRINEVLPEFLEFIAGRKLVAHNANFDIGFIAANAARLGLQAPVNATCTVELSRRIFPRERSHNLDAVAARLGLSTNGTRHRAMADVELTAQAFIAFERKLSNLAVTRA
jgi:DNA polymerase III subunit epsilon